MTLRFPLKGQPPNWRPHALSIGSRILLWDIDGTIMRTTRTGAYKSYFGPALESVFGTTGRLAEMQVSGMTDLQIVCEALRDEGIDQAEVSARVDDICQAYMTAMRAATLSEVGFFSVLPGAREALQEAARHPRFHSALLTGNIRAAAQLKLEAVGLDHFFELPGAFGDESHDRRDLPAFAATRIRGVLNSEIPPEHFIVIGDTPNDIECAKHFGARSVAVASGRLHGIEVLREHEPDALLEGLQDVERFIRTVEMF